MRNHLLTLAVAVSACGRVDEADEAKRLAEQQRAELDSKDAVRGLAVARMALEVFGVLPNYTCGPINGAIGEAIPPVSIPFSCVTVATRAGGMDLTFGDDCGVGGHTVKGNLALEVGVGADRVDVTADFRAVEIDGHKLPVTVGVGICGAEKRMWATVTDVKVGQQTFSLDARVGYRAGLPIIGGASVVLDGTGVLSGAGDVAAEELEYELGAYAPKGGRLTVNRADGSSFSVRFTEVLWKIGKAEVTVTGREPVEVLILQ